MFLQNTVNYNVSQNGLVLHKQTWKSIMELLVVQTPNCSC